MIMSLLLFLSMIFAVSTYYTPTPLIKSEGELDVLTTFLETRRDDEALRIGKKLLDMYPDDVAVARDVQRIIGPLLKDEVGYFKKRYDANPTLANFYLYARSQGFHVPESEVAEWVEREPDNYWAWLMYASTEWYCSNPDPAVIIARANIARTKDTSRPESYRLTARTFKKLGFLEEARTFSEMALACEPENEITKQLLLDIHLNLKNAEAYFGVLNGKYPYDIAGGDLASIASESFDDGGDATVLVYWSPDTSVLSSDAVIELSQSYDGLSRSPMRYAVQLTNGERIVTDPEHSGDHPEFKVMTDLEKKIYSHNIPSHPRIYVIGQSGTVHAVSQETSEVNLSAVLMWLSENAGKN
jgi:hypothetical protein